MFDVSFQQMLASFRTLEADDFKVLNALEKYIRSFESVPPEPVSRSCGLDEKQVLFKLSKLHRMGFVRSPRSKGRSYVLNMLGLDAIALRKLVRSGTIEALGKSIGVGKESDVYQGMSPDGKELAVKFFRIGRTSFTRYARTREYLLGEHSRLAASIRASRREFIALLKLSASNVSVPKPVTRNRHLLVTELFTGTELSGVSLLEKPGVVLGKIMQNLFAAYKAGFIHRDLSHYNILVRPGLDVMIIDWPQWITPKHPEAEKVFRRDVNNVLNFFRRKWGTEIESDAILP